MMKKIDWYDKDAKTLIVGALRANDSLIIGTSDTIFGFLAPLTERGRSLLDETKGRQEKSYIILAETYAKAACFVDQGGLARLEMFKPCWPGPLTLIIQAKPEVPAFMKSKEGTVALRVPNHVGLRAVLHELPGLFSTSANKAGKSVPTTVGALDPELLEHVSYCVTDREQQPKIVPSTIVDCTGPVSRVVREGAYAIADLEHRCGIRLER